ncbi:hypothetical protein BCR44DRAFT_59511, partial [Catenaria anguillulae PL171]
MQAQPGRPNQGPIPRRPGPPPRPTTAPVPSLARLKRGVDATSESPNEDDHDDDDDDDIVSLPSATVTVLLLQILAAFHHSRHTRKTPALFLAGRPAPSECSSSAWPGSYLLLCQWLWDTLATDWDSSSLTVAAFELVAVLDPVTGKRRWSKRAAPLGAILRETLQVPLLTTHRPDVLALDTALSPWHRFVLAVREEVARYCIIGVMSGRGVEVTIRPTFRAADREGSGMRVWREDVLGGVYDSLLCQFPTLAAPQRTYTLLSQLGDFAAPRYSNLAWSVASSLPWSFSASAPGPHVMIHSPRPPSSTRATTRALSLSPAPGDVSDLSDTDELYEDLSGHAESAATLAARMRFNRHLFLHHILLASPLYRNRHVDILVWDPARQAVHAHDRLSQWLDECIEAFHAKHSNCGVPFVWFEGQKRRYVMADAEVWHVLQEVYEVAAQVNGDDEYWRAMRGKVKEDLVVAVVRDRVEGRLEFKGWALERVFRDVGTSRVCEGGRVLLHAGDPPGRGVFLELDSQQPSIAAGRPGSSISRKRRRHSRSSSSPSRSPAMSTLKRARLGENVLPPRPRSSRPRPTTPPPTRDVAGGTTRSSASPATIIRRRPQVAPVAPPRAPRKELDCFIDLPVIRLSNPVAAQRLPRRASTAPSMHMSDHQLTTGVGSPDIVSRQLGDASTRALVRMVQSRVKWAVSAEVDGESVIAVMRAMVEREGEVDVDRVVEEVCREKLANARAVMMTYGS